MKYYFTILSVWLSIAFALPIYGAQFEFVPELTLSEEYTDNLYRTPYSREDDYISIAGLSLTGRTIWQTAGVALTYNPSYVRYAVNDQLNGWRQLAALNIWKNLQKNTRLEFNDNYNETEEPTTVDNFALNPDRERIKTLQNTSEIRLTHNISQRDLFYLAVEYTILRDQNRPAEEDLNDYNALQPSLGFTYWFSELWSIEFNGYYSNRDYKDIIDREEYNGDVRLLRSFTLSLSGFLNYRHTYLNFLENTPSSGYQIMNPSIGVRYIYKENTNITIGAGYYVQDFEDAQAGNTDDASGYNVNAQIIQVWPFRTGNITLSGSSGYDIADTGGQDLGLNIYYAGRVSLEKFFTPRWSANIFFSYRNDQYPNQTPGRIDNTINTGLSTTYQPTRWLNLRLAYNFRQMDSTVEPEDYSENRVTLTVQLTPSRPLRL